MARSRPTIFEQIKDDQRAPQSSSWNTSVVIRWTIIALAVVGTAVFYPGRSNDVSRKTADATLLGTIWTEETVVAEYPFPVRKAEDILARERDSARAATPVVLQIRGDVTAEQAIGALRDSLATIGDRVLTSTLASVAPSLIAEVYASGCINVDAATLGTIVSIRNGGTSERLVSTSNLVDPRRLADRIGARMASAPPVIRARATEVLRGVCRPNLVRNEQLTQRAREDAAASVPRTVEVVRKGDVIVRKTQRIDGRILDKLAAYRDAQYVRSDVTLSWIVVLGSFLHATAVIGILVIYLLYLRRHSFERNAQLASLLSLPVLAAAMGWATVRIPTDLPLEYIILVPVLSMLISVLYEARTAFISTLVMSLTVAGVRGHDHAVGLVLLIAGMLGAYSTNNIQSRTQIFRSILFIFIGMTVSILGVDLERATPPDTMLPRLVLGTVNAVLSPLITFGVIIAMERFLNVATDLRVDEFDNTNHPLLKQLNERAPGTYQHTMAVARLAEAAAAEIGANALLAKVGALYHDIGKLEKSEYFVENQIDIDNKHDKLPPKRSAAIIRQHVQDGIELAKEYDLPERIWKFIPMHHGTILIKHFYNKALEESLLKDAVIDEVDYRYPGPKPDSKETAIVMLADAAEALSRLVDTSQREDIDRAVEKIIVDRFLDGQLDDSPLTITDLSDIRESFVKNLLASTHQRVRYKESREDQPESPSAA
jgi:cyclic-di-AMP phosphodiesterase PgpH